MSALCQTHIKKIKKVRGITCWGKKCKTTDLKLHKIKKKGARLEDSDSVHVWKMTPTD